MAPLTRAGAKRLRQETSATGPPVARKRRKGPEKTEQPFRFLDLPAELRNTVYDFATEGAPFLGFAPAPMKSIRARPYAARSWRFFGLTQACRQIRAEYRPLWQRDSQIQLSTYNIGSYLETFLPTAQNFKHAPKLLQIAWNHSPDHALRHEITRLLLLRAHCSTFRCEFIPHQLAIGETIDDDICIYCVEKFDLEDHDMDEHYNAWTECSCPPPDLAPEDWPGYLYDQMWYTDAMRDLIHHSNEAWLENIREGNIAVRCTMAKGDHHAVFRILYNQELCGSTDDNMPAWQLLKHWGLLELSKTSKVDFILAFEGKEISECNGYEATNSVVREICFTRIPTPPE